MKTCYESMTETMKLCSTSKKPNVRNSISKQHLYYEGDKISIKKKNATSNPKILVSNKKTFESARQYVGKRTAVLNFADAYITGGFPYQLSTQEEVLCRCSTLYPCIYSLKKEFYEYHNFLDKGGFMQYGNDDIIYTPNVEVFKDDTNEEFLDEPFNVDVITCAAPIAFTTRNEKRLVEAINKRAKRIVRVAEANNVEVLILGAFGCGAFGCPADVVAKAFKKAIDGANIDVIEFAVYDSAKSIISNYKVFKDILG